MEEITFMQVEGYLPFFMVIYAICIAGMYWAWISMILKITALQHARFEELRFHCLNCGEPLTKDNSPCPMCGQRNT